MISENFGTSPYCLTLQGFFCWFTGESQDVHAWQAQKSQGKEKEAICIFIMLKSHNYKVNFMTFKMRLKVFQCWSLAMKATVILTTCLWKESKFPTRIFNLWVAKFLLFEGLWASKLLAIYTIGNKVNPITPTTVFSALILFPLSA